MTTSRSNYWKRQTILKSHSLIRFGQKFAAKHWRWYLAGLFALALTNYVALKIPELAKNIVNILTTHGEQEGVKVIAFTMVGLGFLQIFIRSLSRVLMFWPGRMVEADVKEGLFSKLIRIPLRSFYHFSLGDLISRISNDTAHIRVLYAFAVLQIANLLFLIVFTISQMLTVHSGLTVAALTPLLLMIVIMRSSMGKMHYYSKINQVALGQLTSKVTETFLNCHVIQAHVAEEGFSAKIREKNQEVYASDMKLVFIRNFVFPMMTALTGLCEMVVLFFGGYLVIHKMITVGDILAFNVYISYLTWPLTSIGVVLGVIQRARSSIERIEQVFQAPDRGLEPAQKLLSTGVKPVLELRDVRFNYDKFADQTKPEGSSAAHVPSGLARFQLAIDHLSIQPGDIVGFYGAVGSGKSTLFNLLAGLLDPDLGQVCFFAESVKSIPLDQLRSRLVYIPQTTHLFSESIADNIRMGRPDASDKEIMEACRIAQIYEDIQRFDLGFETPIGERGVRISGGQKQRVALARAILKSAPLILLDDALSAVDELTEEKIMDVLLGRYQTVILSSHRKSTLTRCHRLFMLESGTLKEVSQREIELY